MLTDLDVAVRKSGLRVVGLSGWRSNKSNGGEFYGGIGIHHTGAYDSLTDADNDLDYAKWMAFQGRDDLPPPLMNLALSAECVVYVGAAGNANGMGETRATGPMPHKEDGNGLYIVIEAMNSGSQGWGSKGRDRAGNTITQYQAYVRLCAALCLHYGWSAAHVRAHWETSVTGKWDPGDPGSGAGPDGQSMDMTKFRAAVAREMKRQQQGDDDMPKYTDWSKADKEALATDVAAEVTKTLLATPIEADPKLTVGSALRRAENAPGLIRDLATALGHKLGKPGA